MSVTRTILAILTAVGDGGVDAQAHEVKSIADDG